MKFAYPTTERKSIFLEEEGTLLDKRWMITSEQFKDLETKAILIESSLLHFSPKDQKYKSKYTYKLADEYFVCLNVSCNTS